MLQVKHKHYGGGIESKTRIVFVVGGKRADLAAGQGELQCMMTRLRNDRLVQVVMQLPGFNAITRNRRI